MKATWEMKISSVYLSRVKIILIKVLRVLGLFVCFANLYICYIYSYEESLNFSLGIYSAVEMYFVTLFGIRGVKK